MRHALVIAATLAGAPVAFAQPSNPWAPSQPAQPAQPPPPPPQQQPAQPPPPPAQPPPQQQPQGQAPSPPPPEQPATTPPPAAPPPATTPPATTPPPAAPPPTPELLEQARVFYEAGRDAFDGQKYAAAISALEQAYRIVPGRASVQFALGKAYHHQYLIDNDTAKAKRASSLLHDALAGTTGPEREEAVQMLGELTPVVAKYDAERAAANAPPLPPVEKPKTELMIASHTPKAMVSIDHGAPEAAPALVETRPGSHAVHVEAGGFFPDDTDATAVDGRLIAVEIQLRERPGTLRIHAPGGAAVAIDGKPVGVAPLAPLDVPAGKHFIAVTARGHEAFSQEVAVARGQSVAIDAGELRRTGQRRASYLVAGGALLLGGGGLVASAFALSARSDADDLADQRKSGNLTAAQLAQQNQRVDDFTRDTTISYGLYAGAAALLATSAWLYFSDTPRVEAPPAAGAAAGKPAIVPAPVAGGGMTLAVVGSF